MFLNATLFVLAMLVVAQTPSQTNTTQSRKKRGKRTM
jgi:hypothetical protein